MRGAYDAMSEIDKENLRADLMELRDWTDKALEAIGIIYGNGVTVE